MKRIRCFADLAIAGAPPACVEPVHVGRPNIGSRTRFLARVNELLDRTWLTNNGPAVRELEQKLASFLGVKHCVAMCNGTIALEVAARALGLRGEVIVPSYTFVATAHALQWQAITPVFADIDPATHNLAPSAVRSAISTLTTGIVGVHLWGRAAPVEELQSIADEFGLHLMFDASHAFACTYRGVPIGSFGDCEVFSFHATKVFSTFEGGCVTTNDEGLAEKLQLMRNFGFSGYDNVVHPGTNGKMSEIAASFGLTNLEDLPMFLARNEDTYRQYQAALTGIPGVGLVQWNAEERTNYHYVVLEVDRSFPASRDAIVATLQAENVLARKYFWPGCHNMEPYRELYPEAGTRLQHTKAVSERVVVLPGGSAITEEHVQLVRDVLATLARVE